MFLSSFPPESFGRTCSAVSVSAVEDLFSKVLTELLSKPDQPPQLLMVKKYIMKMLC